MIEKREVELLIRLHAMHFWVLWDIDSITIVYRAYVMEYEKILNGMIYSRIWIIWKNGIEMKNYELIKLFIEILDCA